MLSDGVFDESTIIAGFERSRFSFAGGDSGGFYAGTEDQNPHKGYPLDVVSLVFAKDRLKPQGKLLLLWIKCMQDDFSLAVCQFI